MFITHNRIRKNKVLGSKVEGKAEIRVKGWGKVGRRLKKGKDQSRRLPNSKATNTVVRTRSRGSGRNFISLLTRICGFQELLREMG